MHIQFAELPVRDQDRAKRFYVEHLGCSVTADAPMGKDGWRWIELKFAGAETTLHFIRKAADTADGSVMVLVANDVAATIRKLRSEGVEILTEPHQPPWQPGRTVAEFRDSEGNRMVVGS